MNTELLTIKGLSKSFPGVKALDKVDFSLSAGSVHAVCGENGAGKSTLMNILMGIYQRDEGEILLKGVPVSFPTPRHALRAGISIIEQELNPVSEMTIAENLFLGREAAKGGIWVNHKALEKRADKVLQSVGLNLHTATKMKRLSLAQIQLIEIAKAISYNADIIIMDEPTSAIGEKDVETLFATIKNLKEQGKGIIYISHRMKEIYAISDTITIFRDGKYIATRPTKELPRHELISLMIGRKLEDEYVKQNEPTSEVALEVRDFTKNGIFENITVKAHKGEIVGIFGLMGSGRSEFFNALFGVDPADKGTIVIDGSEVHIKQPAQAKAKGMAYVTEDRKISGLVLSSSVQENIALPNLKPLTRFLLINGKREKTIVSEIVKYLGVRTPSLKQLVSRLSGGNQQKVVLCKWLISDPQILLLDEPTRGIDVGAKREIYAFMSNFAAEGNTVLMISSELPEVMGMSDRIVVFKDGQVVAQRSRVDFDQEELMSLASMGIEE